jgi:hypothetical protein
VFDPRQLRHVAAADGRAWGVLDGEHDADAASDAFGFGLRPAEPLYVFAGELVERRFQLWVWWGRESVA